MRHEEGHQGQPFDQVWWCKQAADAAAFGALSDRGGWRPRAHYPDSGKVAGFVYPVGPSQILELRIAPGFEFAARGSAGRQEAVGVLNLRTSRDATGWRCDELIALSEVPPIAFSEAMRDLASILGEPTRSCGGSGVHRIGHDSWQKTIMVGVAGGAGESGRVAGEFDSTSDKEPHA